MFDGLNNPMANLKQDNMLVDHNAKQQYKIPYNGFPGNMNPSMNNFGLPNDLMSNFVIPNGLPTSISPSAILPHSSCSITDFMNLSFQHNARKIKKCPSAGIPRKSSITIAKKKTYKKKIDDENTNDMATDIESATNFPLWPNYFCLYLEYSLPYDPSVRFTNALRLFVKKGPDHLSSILDYGVSHSSATSSLLSKLSTFHWHSINSFREMPTSRQTFQTTT
jgi:hypothetical protein